MMPTHPWQSLGPRLFSDVNALRSAERHRLRVHFRGMDSAVVPS